jgi:hypothetical protein
MQDGRQRCVFKPYTKNVFSYMTKLSRIPSYIGKLFLLHDSAVYVHKCTPDVSHSSPIPIYVFFVENPRYRQNNMFAHFFRDKFKLAFLSTLFILFVMN